jgi:HPt (histidine-containing phosphotransfer) domain-containing protein
MMDKSQIDKFRSGKAYQIFYQEYGERLGFAREMLADEIVPEQRMDLKSRFHMLKGGAGFFGFSEIVRIAKELETMLGSISCVLDEVGRAQLEESLEKLEECYGEIPEPLTEAAEGSSRA